MKVVLSISANSSEVVLLSVVISLLIVNEIVSSSHLAATKVHSWLFKFVMFISALSSLSLIPNTNLLSFLPNQNKSSTASIPSSVSFDVNPRTSFALSSPIKIVADEPSVVVVKLNVVLSAVASPGISVFMVSTTLSTVKFPALNEML